MRLSPCAQFGAGPNIPNFVASVTPCCAVTQKSLVEPVVTGVKTAIPKALTSSV
jgi:hypothetical protein